MTKWSQKNEVEFLTMPFCRADEALEVLRNGFFQEEALCVAVGVAEDRAAQQDLERLALDSAKDGVSIMAIEKKTNRIVGVCYNKFQVAAAPGEKNYFENYRDTKCESAVAKYFINEMLWYDSLVDVYDKYKVDCSLEIMFLATHKDFRRRGIAFECVNASLALARNMPTSKCPKRPPIATSILTSPHTIRIGRIFGFDEIVHVAMQDRHFEGKRFSDNPRIGNGHSGIVVMAKWLWLE